MVLSWQLVPALQQLLACRFKAIVILQALAAFVKKGGQTVRNMLEKDYIIIGKSKADAVSIALRDCHEGHFKASASGERAGTLLPLIQTISRTGQ